MIRGRACIDAERPTLRPGWRVQEREIGRTRRSLMNERLDSLEPLLEGFLIGTSGISDGHRIEEPDALPLPYRRFAREAIAVNHAWIARQTPVGFMIARGFHDPRASGPTIGCLLYVEWMHPDEVRHGSWCRCDPRREREWTFGRGGA